MSKPAPPTYATHESGSAVTVHTLELTRLPQNTAGIWRVPLRAAALLTFSCLVLLVHGYHLGAEDDAIYLPAIKKLVNPSLYPHDAIFFLSQAKETALPYLVALSVRISHLPLEMVIFVWQFAAIFLLLLGCRHISRFCFPGRLCQWGAVALVSALLTLPVAGTALYIADQHLHPRTLATAALLFAIGAVVRKKTLPAALWALAAFLLHPLMAVFGIAYMILLALPLRPWKLNEGQKYWVFPLFFLTPAAGWRQAAHTRGYLFLAQWHWYEWLGVVGPMAIMWLFTRLARKHHLHILQTMSSRLLLFSCVFFLAGTAIALPGSTEALAPLQPMRYLHLVYLFMVLFAGGLASSLVLKRKVWRWALLFVPLCVGMAYAQRNLFASSRQIDWPSSASGNEWVQAFLWVRKNTPVDAYFALNPRYMSEPGEDTYGFRALAERSQLADYSKDPGVVVVSPALAPVWQQQVTALRDWEHFGPTDFHRLHQQFGVDWIVMEGQQPQLDCPYRNRLVSVCRIAP